MEDHYSPANRAAPESACRQHWPPATGLHRLDGIAEFAAIAISVIFQQVIAMSASDAWIAESRSDLSGSLLMPTVTSKKERSSPVPLAAPDVYRMTVDEYDRMAAAGVLDDPRVELIGGLLVRRMTQKPPHVWAVEAAHDHLERILPPGWFIREQKPVRIPRFDEPEPDLSVLRGTRDD
jgi:hypothetical protein